jgi:hypothetical protein
MESTMHPTPATWRTPSATIITSFYLVRWTRTVRNLAHAAIESRPFVAGATAFPSRADAEAAVATTEAGPRDFFTIDITPRPACPQGRQFTAPGFDHRGPMARYYGPWDRRHPLEATYARLMRQPGTRMMMTGAAA